jgi:hypothetical protein
MLTLRDIRKLRCEVGYPKNGTRLIIIRDVYPGMEKGTSIEFVGFNSFYSATGECKVSHDRGFGRAGGARCWDHFTKRGRAWIDKHYLAHTCQLMVDVPHIGIQGIKSSDVRIK